MHVRVVRQNLVTARFEVATAVLVLGRVMKCVEWRGYGVCVRGVARCILYHPFRLVSGTFRARAIAPPRHVARGFLHTTFGLVHDALNSFLFIKRFSGSEIPSQNCKSGPKVPALISRYNKRESGAAPCISEA